MIVEVHDILLTATLTSGNRDAVTQLTAPHRPGTAHID